MYLGKGITVMGYLNMGVRKENVRNIYVSIDVRIIQSIP
jgi:hypothetical protein